VFGALASRLFGNGKKSKSVAKSRLSFVLVQDRTGLGAEDMARFRGELVEVIQRYFIIDESGFDIDYERSGDTTTLIINSPVVVKRQEGLNGHSRAKHIKPVAGSSLISTNGSSTTTGSNMSSKDNKISDMQANVAVGDDLTRSDKLSVTNTAVKRKRRKRRG
jgi:cell division topological specificity factor